ncbi:MAG TPA: LysE family transporter [Desulfatiglandales bacterium]
MSIRGEKVESEFFIKGLIAGFLICAPFGPIGLLCVRITLVDGKLAGVASVLGASVVDALYCAVAGLGISYISNFLRNEHTPLQVAGGLVLIIMGISVFLSHPSEKDPESKGHGVLGALGSSFLLMLANPISILVFTATFTGLGIQGWQDAQAPTAALVLGVFAGSALWAPIFVAAVSLFRPQLTLSQLRFANRITGAILFFFGAVVCLLALLR